MTNNYNKNDMFRDTEKIEVRNRIDFKMEAPKIVVVANLPICLGDEIYTIRWFTGGKGVSDPR